MLEQDFENAINSKNNTSRELGQVISSVNNIFKICRDQKLKRGTTL